MASKKGHQEVVKLLLENGANDFEEGIANDFGSGETVRVER